MEVLTVINQVQKGSYVYSVMGYDEKPSFVHINSTKTNGNSVLVPIEVLHDLIYNKIPI
jgi:hypothetical protein